MKTKIQEKIKEYESDIIKHTCDIIKIKSILNSPLESKPFGEGINNALEFMLTKGKEFGFNVNNFDGYAGHIEYGNSTNSVAAICHLDVVPAGDGWTFDPFGGIISDGKIYGRGTVDDKGPAIACLYAMKIIKDLDLAFDKNIRLILGTDEETGCRGIEYYLKKVPNKPLYGFSPDGEFPIIYAEKGIIHLELSFDLEDEKVITCIKSGNRANMVPDYAKAILYTDQKISDIISDFKDKVSLEQKDKGIQICCAGKSAHGSTPEMGINAASYLINVMSMIDHLSNTAKEVFKFLDDKIGFETNGKKLGIYLKDDVSGELTLNLGIMDINEKGGKIILDIRYPVTLKYENVYDKIKESFDNLFKIKILSHKPPLYMPKDEPVISMLSEAYETATDKNAQLIAIGGGTYCRNIKNTVAFGPVFPRQEELAHKANENISIEDLVKLTEIYTYAFINMARGCGDNNDK